MLLLSVCVCKCLDIGTEIKISFFHFNICFLLFISFCRNCKYHHAEISLLQFPELIGHIAFFLKSLPGSVTKATNPWLMIH